MLILRTMLNMFTYFGDNTEPVGYDDCRLNVYF